MLIRRFEQEDAKAVSELIRTTVRISNSKDYPPEVVEELINIETPEHVMERAYKLALSEGFTHIYISTGETGLYEKYGYTFWKTMPDIYGDESRVYRIEVSFHSLPGNCSSR
jgi:hypothetical protein